MRTDEQIKAEARASGHIGMEKLQLEVLLDIRELQAQTFKHLKTLLRKPGRPRNKKKPTTS